MLGANMKMAQVMETTGKTMKNMNNLVRPEQVAANMRDFSQASMKLDMTEEMSKYVAVWYLCVAD